MLNNIISAIGRTYSFKGWSFDNEAEFKHEMFHQLSFIEVNNIGLASIVPGLNSCRLHSEGKVENGNPLKADLLICDPKRLQHFNYGVDYALELKKVLSGATLKQELKKLSDYKYAHPVNLLVALKKMTFDPAELIAGIKNLHVVDPGSVPNIQGDDFTSGDTCNDLDTAIGIIRQAIDETLWLYGNGKIQYHSFFWCNYEHETELRHSFPCEGDFNAQLYHKLRMLLPENVEIRSEVHPPNQSTRVDLVVSDRAGKWCIPIDVKMNWTQFKPAYHQGNIKESEASVIMKRLKSIAASYTSSHPIVVVIQGEWQPSRDIKAEALPLLKKCSYPLELVMFNEVRNRIDRLNCV